MFDPFQFPHLSSITVWDGQVGGTGRGGWERERWVGKGEVGGKGSGGWGHLEGAVHMEAARHSCKRAMGLHEWA